MILLLLVFFDEGNLFLIFVQLLLLISNQVTQLHLLLNQVLCLGERANELVPLFSFERMYFVLVPDIDSFEILFFVLKFNLFVTELLTQTLFFFIKMQEDLNITIKLSFLLILYNLLDLSLLHHILSFLLLEHLCLFLNFLFHLSFQFSELLSLLADMLMHSELHLVQILLIDLPGLPKGQSILSLGCRVTVLDINSRC